MKKIAVLISGSGSNLEAIINACNSKNIDGTVISVICNDPKAYGIKRAKNLNIERAAAQNYIERYFSKYPSVRQYMEFTKETARQNGYIETFFGRKLWVPDINGSNGMRRAAAERAAINGPMQGTAADLIKMAMVAGAEWS